MSVPFLSGIRVLDLSRLLPGGLCTMHLAEKGAEVIKVEEPGEGDYLRWVADGAPGKSSRLFRAVNRQKRSLTLNLKHEDGRAIFFEMCRRSDVLVESFRPGVTKKLGIDFEAVSLVRPQIVYCSITGYGQHGPWSQRSGHDINYMAVSGIVDRTGSPGGPPVIPGFPISDVVGALSSVRDILAALFAVQRSGQGQHIDISMFNCSLENHVMAMTSINANGHSAPRGRDRYTGDHAGYAIYRTADDRYVAAGALEDKFWRELCSAIGLPALATSDPRDPEVHKALEKAFLLETTEYWDDLFRDVDCCVTPVLSPYEALGSNHALVRGFVPSRGAFPANCDEPASDRLRPAPELGDDNVEILSELGLDRTRISGLAELGVI